jgi:hypothetical protein
MRRSMFSLVVIIVLGAAGSLPFPTGARDVGPRRRSRQAPPPKCSLLALGRCPIRATRRPHVKPSRFDEFGKLAALRRLSRCRAVCRAVRGLGADAIAAALFGVRRDHAIAICPNYGHSRRFTEAGSVLKPALPLPGGPRRAC